MRSARHTAAASAPCHASGSWNGPIQDLLSDSAGAGTQVANWPLSGKVARKDKRAYIDVSQKARQNDRRFSDLTKSDTYFDQD